MTTTNTTVVTRTTNIMVTTASRMITTERSRFIPSISRTRTKRSSPIRWWVMGLVVSVIFTITITASFAAASSSSSLPLSSSSTSSSPSSSSPAYILDLSYLHRTSSSRLADTVEQVLEQQQQQQQDMNNGRNNNNINIIIDLTASLIGKNVSDLVSALALSSLQPSPSLTAEEDEVSTPVNSELDLNSRTVMSSTSTTATTLSPATTIDLHLKVRQNHWLPDDIASFLQMLFREEVHISEIDKDNDKRKDQAIQSKSTISKINATAEVADQKKEDDDDGGGGSVSNETSTKADINETTVVTREALDTPLIPPKPAFVTVAPKLPKRKIKSLDLGWNRMCIPDRDVLSSSSSNVDTDSTSQRERQQRRLVISKIRKEKKAMKDMNQQIRKVIENGTSGPTSIHMDVCGIGPSTCRSIAKGIINRYIDEAIVIDGRNTAFHEKDETKHLPPPSPPPPPHPLSLFMARNDGMGDPGVVALAAAIRTVATKLRQRKLSLASSSGQTNSQGREGDTTVLEVLDLSGCAVSDVGVKALAIALERNPYCIGHLDLSNNQISNEGAKALANALSSVDGGKIKSLDLSYNTAIDDTGAIALASVVESGNVQNLTVRSCSIHADGAASFGSAIRVLASSRSSEPVPSGSLEITPPNVVSIDLSGNPLGLLRKKPKSKNKFSTKELTSKATATTTAYVNLIGKTVQKGLKDLGLDTTDGNPDTLESDDEEESKMGSSGIQDDDESKMKCGALSFAESFIIEDDDEDGDVHDGDHRDGTKKKMSDISKDGPGFRVHIGLRHCSFDTRAADALAAVVLEAQDNLKFRLQIDATMNHVLEEDVVDALLVHDESSSAASSSHSLLTEMAERYLEAQEILRESRRRAAEAARVAASRPSRRQTSAYDHEVDYEDDHEYDENDWDYDQDDYSVAEDDDNYSSKNYGYERQRLQEEYEMDGSDGGWDSDADYEWDGEDEE